MTRFTTNLLASTALFATVAAAQDPFDQGTRWVSEADAQNPWIPEQIHFGARENLAFLGAGGATPTFASFDRAAAGTHTARFADGAFLTGATHVRSVAGWGTRAAVAAQFPAPTPAQRSTMVAGYDAAAAAQGAAFAPTWTHDADLITNGPAHLGSDAGGALVVLALWNSSNSSAQVDFLDGTTGALLQRVNVPAAALNQLEVSEDGSVVAVAAGLDLYLFDGAGAQLHHEAMNSATKALSLSGDGSALAVGGISQIAVLSPDSRGAWTTSFNAFHSSNQIAAAADLSRDGKTLGVAWWNYANGVDVRFDIWDLESASLATTVPIKGTYGGPQNLPQVVEVTPDGTHVAFGTWGNGSFPEVLVLAPGEDLPLYGVDTPGSVRDLDLSEDGKRVLVAYKSTHNNVFSNAGGVLLFEDGTQTISQHAPAKIGTVLDVSTNQAGASAAFLLIGERSTPFQFPGVTGKLLLDRTTLSVLIQPTQNGRADFSVSVPDDLSLVGTQLSMQPAWRAFGGTLIAPEVIDPLIFE